ncbi:alpha/beta family hydrolase [Oceanibacterium hippocampi]|uniref:Alpha/beta hydrolase family protein n=1 Tax=Oceanibacterium hippocampi TaxID=745714 RepID=A0A1Y5R913_9PROT|nr:alpha/beta family hydrolase [Oceanibacterium hippocampi]SLN11962.1 Alpha/beta hydrolase family protein [Oceanibacterium hippocampi]
MSAAILFDGPKDAPFTLVLAHGAGAPMDSPFMAAVAQGLGARGRRVARFEFPYMVERRASGRKKPPDRQPVLLECWRAIVAELGGGSGLVIGGKSMGGRMASLVADECGVRGLVCLGYPFHPPGKPEKLRTAHLETLRTPALIVQGERDSFGGRADVEGYALSPAIRFTWMTDGDHGFRPRKASGLTEADNLAAAIEAVDAFLAACGG